MAANLTYSIQSPWCKDWLLICVPIIVGFITAGGALGAVYLKGYLDDRTERKKARIDAYQGFLDAFSGNRTEHELYGKEIELYNIFLIQSGDYLKAALKVIEFGNIPLPESKLLHLPQILPTPDQIRKSRDWERNIQSLNDLINLILELRYTTKLDQSKKVSYLEVARKTGMEEFGQIILDFLGLRATPDK